VSAVARSRGSVADRSAVQEVQVAISAKPGDIDIAFWRAVLGYVPLAEDNAVDPLGHGSTVWMQELSPARPLRHAMHVDVSVAREHADARVAAALAAGGSLVDDADAPRKLDPPGPRRQQSLHRRLAGRRDAARPVRIAGLIALLGAFGIRLRKGHRDDVRVRRDRREAAMLESSPASSIVELASRLDWSLVDSSRSRPLAE
jgi:hypothetical protein